MPDTTLSKAKFDKNGVSYREVVFMHLGSNNANGQHRWLVYERERIENIFGTIKWENNYINEFPNREYARTAYIGRVVKAAFEEGNITDAKQEDENKRMNNYHNSVMGS